MLPPFVIEGCHFPIKFMNFCSSRILFMMLVRVEFKSKLVWFRQALVPQTLNIWYLRILQSSGTHVHTHTSLFAGTPCLVLSRERVTWNPGGGSNAQKPLLTRATPCDCVRWTFTVRVKWTLSSSATKLGYVWEVGEVGEGVDTFLKFSQKSSLD